jgi:hypothetical protein
VTSTRGILPGGSRGLARWGGSPPLNSSGGTRRQWPVFQGSHGGSAATGGRRIWEARSRALKDGLADAHDVGWMLVGQDPGENLVYGRWPELVMVTPLAVSFLKASSR